MTTYYKATRSNGTDFRTSKIDYSVIGSTISHPNPNSDSEDAAFYLSVATVPTDCTGFKWPARLFEVEVTNEWTPHPVNMPNKRACTELTILSELPAWQLFGKYGETVVKILETKWEAKHLKLARAYVADAYADAAAYVAATSADGAAYVAAYAAATSADVAANRIIRRAALAFIVKDLITAKQFDLLTKPWISIFGEL